MDVVIETPSSAVGSNGAREKKKRLSSKEQKKANKIAGKLTRASCKFAFEPWKLVNPHHRKQCGGAEGGCHACVVERSLRMVSRGLVRASNTAARALLFAESAWLDAFQIEKGRLPSFDEFKAKALPCYSYPRMKKLVPYLSGGVASAAGRSLDQDWSRWRFDILVRMNRKPPFYTSVPIPVRAQDYTLTFDSERDVYLFDFRLLSEAETVAWQNRGRVTIPIEPKDAYQAHLLENLSRGHWKKGEAIITRDTERDGRWFVRFAYSKIVPPLAPSDRVAAINRGIGCFFAVITHTGEDFIYDGLDIVATLKQFQRRRKGYQRQIKAAGNSRRGHGRERALQPTEKLRGKYVAWRNDKIKVIVSRLGAWLSEREITKLYIEDFTGIRTGARARLGDFLGQLVHEWPWYQLGLALETMCGDLGITCVQVPPGADYELAKKAKKATGDEAAPVLADDADKPSGGIAETCPRCGAVDPTAMHFLRRSYKCKACGFRRHLDVSTAANVLIRGERHAGVPKMDLARKLDFLKGHAPLRGPSTNAVMATPGVSVGGEGAPRKPAHKRAGSNGKPKTRGKRKK